MNNTKTNAKNPIKAIKFYLRNNCDTEKIRDYINEIFETDLTMSEIREAINHIQNSKG